MATIPQNLVGKVSQVEYDAAAAAGSQLFGIQEGERNFAEQTYRVLVNTKVLEPSVKDISELEAISTIPKVSAKDVSAVEADIQAKDIPPAPGSLEEAREKVKRLRGSGVIDPRAKRWQLGNKKLSIDIPPDPLGFEAWKRQEKQGFAEAVKEETTPSLNLFDTPSQLSNIATGTVAGETAAELIVRKKKENEAIEAQRIRDQAEADRAILEQMKNKKEGELLQYKTDYFASPQVGIYIGDRWVGNAITIEFTENVSKSPLYGYASTHFDAVAKGNVIVQGQFSIAYTGENYLPAILQRYKDTEGVGDTVPFLVKDPIERAKKLFWNLENINESVKTLPLEYGYFEGKTGLVGNGFNIRVFYGSQKFLLDSFGTGSGNLKFEGPVQTILNVHLTSRSLIVQPTGDPIGESYTFFARAITTGVSRQSINPNRVLRSRQGQINISTTTGTTPTNARNEPNSGNP